MTEYDLFMPIKKFGLFIMGVGLAGIVSLVLLINDSNLSVGAIAFVAVISALHLLIGHNIISRNRFGYGCLKFYLYSLAPCYPIGYNYSKKMLEYIEDNKIKTFFGKSLII